MPLWPSSLCTGERCSATLPATPSSCNVPPNGAAACGQTAARVNHRARRLADLPHRRAQHELQRQPRPLDGPAPLPAPNCAHPPRALKWCAARHAVELLLPHRGCTKPVLAAAQPQIPRHHLASPGRRRSKQRPFGWVRRRRGWQAQGWCLSAKRRSRGEEAEAWARRRRCQAQAATVRVTGAAATATEAGWPTAAEGSATAAEGSATAAEGSAAAMAKGSAVAATVMAAVALEAVSTETAAVRSAVERWATAAGGSMSAAEDSAAVAVKTTCTSHPVYWQGCQSYSHGAPCSRSPRRCTRRW
eukprot:scaffold40040_cov81-Phaeocystis_antarctica.AAC.2